MVIEIKLEYAGAVALIAQRLGAKIEEVYINAWSVEIDVPMDNIANRLLVAECERTNIIYKGA
ncbi:hypothetical protein HOT48_gp245 [Klebsiella phage ZCKP1]|uniref:Uncharacterized protein n=1 Tax=Klebsiella phage ZCKP1 TaxID=2201417 RepID=A0A2Z4QDA9_9CAUD|nr:hypothetical protein HOT48_gp245 [Klebsiella phage ZCKP1]AWY08260.1 hypothetical protein [Klebsiella phage ZCKP1]